jgi:hypothetical protein
MSAEILPFPDPRSPQPGSRPPRRLERDCRPSAGTRSPDPGRNAVPRRDAPPGHRFDGRGASAPAHAGTEDLPPCA